MWPHMNILYIPCVYVMFKRRPECRSRYREERDEEMCRQLLIFIGDAEMFFGINLQRNKVPMRNREKEREKDRKRYIDK